MFQDVADLQTVCPPARQKSNLTPRRTLVGRAKLPVAVEIGSGSSRARKTSGNALSARNARRTASLRGRGCAAQDGAGSYGLIKSHLYYKKCRPVVKQLAHWWSSNLRVPLII